MNNKLVSIVVPIYQVQEYLKRCVDSILKQTYKKIEIILVDDGSTDACPQICDDYKEKDDSQKENTEIKTTAHNKTDDEESGSDKQAVQSDEKKSVIQKEMLFSKWIIGEPFSSEEIIQIPVRLYCKYGTIDVTLYLNRQKSNAVNLITIDRWKKV